MIKDPKIRCEWDEKVTKMSVIDQESPKIFTLLSTQLVSMKTDEKILTDIPCIFREKTYIFEYEEVHYCIFFSTSSITNRRARSNSHQALGSTIFGMIAYNDSGNIPSLTFLVQKEESFENFTFNDVFEITAVKEWTERFVKNCQMRTEV